jgi:hypothetical protein
MKFKNQISVTRIFFSCLTLFAVGVQLQIHLRMDYRAVNFFSYFTNLSNIFISLVLLVAGYRGIKNQSVSLGFEILRGAAVACMILVGIVFHVLLANSDLGSLDPWVNFQIHTVMPIVAVLDWIANPPQHALKLKQSFLWLIPVALYTAYSLIRGALTNWYPYSFFDPAAIGGYGGVAVYCLCMLAGFLLFSVLLTLSPRWFK